MHLFVLIAIAVSVTFGAKLPSVFTKCNRNEKNFDTCLTKAIEDGMHELTKNPHKEIGLVSLNPLEVPSLFIGTGNGPIQFEQNYTNVKLTGYDEIKCDKTSLDFEANTLEMDCIVPRTILKADVASSGKVFLLPINGKGQTTITLENIHSKAKVFMETYKKHGKTFYRVVKTELHMQPAGVHFQFNNFFNGDKILEDNLSKVLNDNSLQIYDDFRTSYDDTFAQILGNIINRMMAKMSIEELFE